MIRLMVHMSREEQERISHIVDAIFGKFYLITLHYRYAHNYICIIYIKIFVKFIMINRRLF